MSKLTIALCGNPNCGKTTLFNRLTGSNQKVGNWAGVTVERKQGAYKNDNSVIIVDTPGAYSLTPYSPDEKITADYLTCGEPNLIINVVDATNLERNLLLTTQLLDLQIPVVVALNFMDEAQANGINVSPQTLKQQLKCDVFYISAAKNVGIEELMDFCTHNPPSKNSRTKFPDDVSKRYEKIRSITEASRNCDGTESRSRLLTRKIDKIVLNKWLAFPIFFAVMAAIFYLSIGSLGKWLTSIINDRFTPLIQQGAQLLLAKTDLPWLSSLVCDGIIGGVMSVASFVPQIMLLFGCIAVLEASGYMSRVAFITDRALNKLGLGGRSFVSILLGCGCSVPAIMSTRTIKNVNERNATITLAPYAPCSAKLAVISFFTAKIFGGNALVAISFYLLSIAAIIVGGLLLKLFRRSNPNNDAFIMELPNYRRPTAINVFKQMWQRGKSFLIKAGTVIFAASVVLWAMQNFNFKFQSVSVENSMLAQLGELIAPLFIPLGFADGGYGWQFSVATVSGLAAKETVVTTLEILLPTSVEHCISRLGAFCFVTYNLLTAPCIAAISAGFAEQGGLKQGAKTLAFQICFAYVTTLAIYQTASLAKKHIGAVAALSVIAAAAIAFAVSVKRFAKCGACCDCANDNCAYRVKSIKK